MKKKEMIKQILELKEKLEYATSRFEILHEIEKIRNYNYYGNREGKQDILWEGFLRNNTKDDFKFTQIIADPLSFTNEQLENVLIRVKEYYELYG